MLRQETPAGEPDPRPPNDMKRRCGRRSPASRQTRGSSRPRLHRRRRGGPRKGRIEDGRVVARGHARRSAARERQQPRKTPACNSRHRSQDRYSTYREHLSGDMSDGHRHEGAAHDHAAELRDVSRRRLILALALTASFLVVEVVAGICRGAWRCCPTPGTCSPTPGRWPGAVGAGARHAGRARIARPSATAAPRSWPRRRTESFSASRRSPSSWRPSGGSPPPPPVNVPAMLSSRRRARRQPARRAGTLAWGPANLNLRAAAAHVRPTPRIGRGDRGGGR